LISKVFKSGTIVAGYQGMSGGETMARMTNTRNNLTGFKRQTCAVCKCKDKFNFHVPDNVWGRIVPAEYQNKVVCLSCFDEFARKAGIDYSDSLEVLYFAGNQATFKFQTVSAQSV
jgi:hypothetical protein